MNIENFKTAIETLEAQNENGQFDQVINQMKVQLQDLQKAEEEARKEAELVKRIEEKWGLTKPQYDEVIKTFKSGENPTDDAYEFNNKQLKLLAHKWATEKDLIDVDGEFKTLDEAIDVVENNPSYYIDFEDYIAKHFDVFDEDEIYEKMVEMRDDEYETEEDGNILHEEDEVA